MIDPAPVIELIIFKPEIEGRDDICDLSGAIFRDYALTCADRTGPRVRERERKIVDFEQARH